ncbi:MAG: DegT/DnrJ/EryC1/StrS aminotransferase family protein [Planctomyces sp.]|nr:DegT/DnrJ/EryC1/StrS aminotransferase family protein [Planctomyces sp.]
MSATIPAVVGELPGWPEFDDEQREAVDRVLRSGRVNYWTGEETRLFEREYAAALDVPHAVAVSNGTVALECALAALEVGPGDEVVVPSRTFLATASSVAMRGARPVFADVDANSGNMTAGTVEAVLTPRTKAVIAVHLAGWPCEMDELCHLARSRGLAMIEDCAQAHGATYRGRPVGTWGDIGCFSFCQDKILTTGGEGGLVVTSDPQLWQRMWSFKDHGKSWDAVYNRTHSGLFKWLHESLGTNGRMAEMQAAIGRIQLRRLGEWSSRRRRNAAAFDVALAGVPGLHIVTPPAHVEHAYYKYYAFVEERELTPGWTRDRLALTLQQAGVPCGSGSCSEIYREGALAPFAPETARTTARRLGETSLMLLVHPTLTEAHIRAMGDAVRAAFFLAADERPRLAA